MIYPYSREGRREEEKARERGLLEIMTEDIKIINHQANNKIIVDNLRRSKFNKNKSRTPWR